MGIQPKPDLPDLDNGMIGIGIGSQGFGGLGLPGDSF